MEGKIIKKTVPNVPLVREKPKEEILEGEIGDELEEISKEMDLNISNVKSSKSSLS